MYIHMDKGGGGGLRLCFRERNATKREKKTHEERDIPTMNKDEIYFSHAEWLVGSWY